MLNRMYCIALQTFMYQSQIFMFSVLSGAVQAFRHRWPSASALGNGKLIVRVCIGKSNCSMLLHPNAIRGDHKSLPCSILNTPLSSPEAVGTLVQSLAHGKPSCQLVSKSSKRLVLLSISAMVA